MAEEKAKKDKKAEVPVLKEGKAKRRQRKRPGKKNRIAKAKKEALLKKQASQEGSESEDEGVESEEEAPKAEGGEKKIKTKANRLNEENYDQTPRGVIFIGQLPDGFFEPQISKYFRQFGKVTRYRLARSKKTGLSRGYGWVEFEEMEVAQIVAQTMNKYMMFGKVLQVEIVPPEKVPPKLFYRWKQRWIAFGSKNKKAFDLNFNDRPTVEVDGEQLPQVTFAQVRRREKQLSKLKAQLEQLGIEYDLSPFEERQDEEVARARAEWKEGLASKASAEQAAEAAKAQSQAEKAAKRAAKEQARKAAEEATKATNEAQEALEASEVPAKASKGKKGAKAAKVAEVEAVEEAAEAPDASGEAKTKKKKKRKAAEVEEGEAEGAPAAEATADGNDGAAGVQAEQKAPGKKKKKKTKEA